MYGVKVLIVDDDIFIRQMIEELFKQEKATVITAANGREGFRTFFEQHPQLVILDLVMPYVNGWELCRQIRQLSEVPIIMLTSLSGEEEEVRGLEYGAVDYITKPFRPKVLLARAKAILRQSSSEQSILSSNEYSDGYLTVDLEAKTVFVEGNRLKLTKTEYKLLAYLIVNAGIVLTAPQILNHVWDWDYQENVSYIHVYMSRLRHKLEPDPEEPQYLSTIRGQGYCFNKHSW